MPDFLVMFLIPSDLRCLEVSVSLWHRVELATLVAVPKADVDEHHRPILGPHVVRFPRHSLFIDPFFGVFSDLSSACQTESYNRCYITHLSRQL